MPRAIRIATTEELNEMTAAELRQYVGDLEQAAQIGRSWNPSLSYSCPKCHASMARDRDGTHGSCLVCSDPD